MFNKVILAGRLVADPELMVIKNGKDTQLCRFRIASNTVFRSKKETLFIRVVVFGNQAVRIKEHLKKGDPVIVDGRLRMDQYTGKNQEKTISYEVIANRVVFLPRKKERTPTIEEIEPEMEPF
ncbi:MAG: single-stranded DNA-binding protein [Dictyoglomus turgidum]